MRTLRFAALFAMASISAQPARARSSVEREAVASRRSVRAFTDEPVDRAATCGVVEAQSARLATMPDDEVLFLKGVIAEMTPSSGRPSTR